MLEGDFLSILSACLPSTLTWFPVAGVIALVHLQIYMSRLLSIFYSSVTVMANGPVGVVSGGAKNVRNVEVLLGSGTKQPEMSSQSQRQSHISASKRSSMASSGTDAHAESVAPLTLAGVCTSASDPVLVPSDSRVPAAVSAIKSEVGNHSSSVKPNPNICTDHKSNAGKDI